MQKKYILKNNKAFTMVEMLVVIAILSIILLIASPILLDKINESKNKIKSNQEAFIVSAAEKYIVQYYSNITWTTVSYNANLKKAEISLKELSDYGFIDLPIYNSKTGEPYNPNNTFVTAFKDKEESVTFEFGEPLVHGKHGDAVTLANYNWHIIGEDQNNIYLLLDAGQLSNMNHCRTGSSSNCTWNGEYYVYSWEKSLIRDYLNTTFYNALITNNPNIAGKIVSTEVCKDSSLYSSDTWSYGGYTKGEITKLQEIYPSITCNSGYTSDKVRLISQSEYYNLTNYSTYASTTTYPYAAPGGNGKGYIPKVSYITNRVNDSSWLYSSTISNWWTMSAASNSYAGHVQNARIVSAGGLLGNYGGEYSSGVRALVVLQK